MSTTQVALRRGLLRGIAEESEALATRIAAESRVNSDWIVDADAGRYDNSFVQVVALGKRRFSYTGKIYAFVHGAVCKELDLSTLSTGDLSYLLSDLQAATSA